jgi:crotonobetainyl-CoA:carnitine CoA-transferase CaiB-like acyl-CoA transferase
MTGPLTGLRVIDLTQVLSGPFCTMLLADMGADVIKVEPPEGDVARQWGPFVPGAPGMYGGYFASVNRNKRSVVLDLKSPEGITALHGLLGDADVIVENFRVGVMDRLGLSWESLHERYPRLVYAAIRGFGDPRTGSSPYASWPAFDIIAQAMGGLMSITGPDEDHPVKAGPGIGDTYPATLAATGILAAAWQAQRTGRGEFVDVALYDAILALSERIVYQYSLTGEVPHPQGNTHPLLCPYGVVATADGHWAIAAPTDHHWRMLARAMGRPELADDPRFATNAERVRNSAAVYGLVEEWTRTRSTAELMREVGGEFPCAPVNTAAEIRVDPHIAARSMIRTVDHPSGARIDIAGAPVKFGSAPGEDPRRAPLLGEHTAEVLSRAR